MAVRLQALLADAGFPLENIDRSIENIEITGISANSAKIKKGEVFIAVKGLNVDGYEHIGEAVARGAVFVISEREVLGTPYFLVENAREAYARLLNAFWNFPTKGIRLIGVTGTNGKTTVSHMLGEILTAAGYRTGVIGTVGCFVDGRRLCIADGAPLANMTTPDPAELYPLLAEMRDLGVNCIVMEVTSHALAFSKVAPLWFDLAVFTNLTEDHLDFHLDIESYFLEKRKLFSMCSSAVISASTPYGALLSDTAEVQSFVVKAEETLHNIQKNGEDGVSFSLLYQGEYLSFSIPVPGDFMVEDGALAAAAGLMLGVPKSVVKKTLEGFFGVKGRLERVAPLPFDVNVFLDYAHTPDALEKLLLCVRDFKKSDGKITLLFGCGGDRDRTKRPKMGRIATTLADHTIITSDNSRSEDPRVIIEDILRGVDKERSYEVIVDRREAIRAAVYGARKGDILILAGKGHENYEIKDGKRLPFSERELVVAFFEERGREKHAD